MKKQLVLVIEGTAALAPYWPTIFSDYLHKLITSFCGNQTSTAATTTGSSSTDPNVELALVIFNTHNSFTSCFLQRSSWTGNVQLFFEWLSAIHFTGGGFGDSAIAEGLAEALLMFPSPSGNQIQHEVFERHCILVAASNPCSVPTHVYRPTHTNETLAETCFSDAETLAKSFPQCSVSLSVICPTQLPKLKAIYNAGKRNPLSPNPTIDTVKNPHYLVLISKKFMKACTALSPSKISGNIPPAIVKVEPGTYSSARARGTYTGISLSVGSNNHPETNIGLPQQISNPQQLKQSYEKIWKGSLYGMRLGQPVFLSEIEAYRKMSSSVPVIADWPSTMYIERLISEDHMKNKRYAANSDFLIFRALTQHGFLGQLHQKKLCAVIRLPSQTLLLAVSDKASRLIAMLIDGTASSLLGHAGV